MFFFGCKKSLLSGKCKPKLATTTTKDKHNPPPPTQNPNREEGKNCHHCSIAITTHKKSTTIHTKPTTTRHKNHQKIQNITTHTTTTIKKSEFVISTNYGKVWNKLVHIDLPIFSLGDKKSTDKYFFFLENLIKKKKR